MNVVNVLPWGAPETPDDSFRSRCRESFHYLTCLGHRHNVEVSLPSISMQYGFGGVSYDPGSDEGSTKEARQMHSCQGVKIATSIDVLASN